MVSLTTCFSQLTTILHGRLSFQPHLCNRSNSRRPLQLCTSSTLRNASVPEMRSSSSVPGTESIRDIEDDDENNILPRDLDVVITHSTADFDSLAAAVGLAKLRGPHTLVVTPGGESPSLRRFLALHRQLFDIIDAKAVDPRRLRWVGVVDTVRKDRLGIAAEWPSYADEVIVFDHHVGRKCDIANERRLEVVVEDVGAVATLICERLMHARHVLTPAEATLLALAIHSDTGSLTFEQTTPRDASALAWLLSQGAIQRSIAEFTQSFLTDEQQVLLSKGLSTVRRYSVHGVEIGSLCMVGRSFLKGMSKVASDLLDIANLDVLILAYINCRGRKAKKRPRVMNDDFCGPEQLKQVSIIGRARARVDGIDFNALFTELGGGGHARAASASMKLTESDAEDLIEKLVKQAASQIPEARPVSEFMTTLLVTVSPNSVMSEVQHLMSCHGHQILPVVDEDKVLQGLIAVQDVQLAQRRRGQQALDMSVKAWLHQNVVTVDPGTPFYVAEKTLAENTLGMLPVVDQQNMLLGAITRTDVLVARRWLPEQLVSRQFGIA